MTKGRSHGHRWVRLDGSLYNVRHYFIYGPGGPRVAAALAAILDADELGRVTDDFDDPGTGKMVGRQVQPFDPERPYFTVVFVRDTSEALATFVHECFHAMTATLGYVGVKASWRNDEAAAYYLAWLFGARTGLGL